MLVATPGKLLLRDIAMRLVLMMLVMVAAMFLAGALRAPRAIARPLIMSFSVAITLARIHPRGTPNRWRKNALSWGVHALFLTAGYMLMDHWWGE